MASGWCASQDGGRLCGMVGKVASGWRASQDGEGRWLLDGVRPGRVGEGGFRMVCDPVRLGKVVSERCASQDGGERNER